MEEHKSRVFLWSNCATPFRPCGYDMTEWIVTSIVGLLEEFSETPA